MRFQRLTLWKTDKIIPEVAYSISIDIDITWHVWSLTGTENKQTTRYQQPNPKLVYVTLINFLKEAKLCSAKQKI